MTVSLKTEILGRLGNKKAKTSRPSRKVAVTESRNNVAVVTFKRGDSLNYKNKPVVLESYNRKSGMALVRMGKNSQIIVRGSDLKPQTLNEGVLGMASIGSTWTEPRQSMTKLETLSLEDIGFVSLREDEDTGEQDEQEEGSDNGSNIRHDGHTGKLEVDELPTPSDTIAPAYSDKKPPKVISKPLSTAPGYTVATDPDLDAYDYPADAPEIPEPEFQGDEAGNARAPDYGDGHDGGDGLENREEPEDDERTDEAYMGFQKLEQKLAHKTKNPGAVAAAIGRKKYGKKKFQAAAANHKKMHEAFTFVSEDVAAEYNPPGTDSWDNVPKSMHGHFEDVPGPEGEGGGAYMPGPKPPAGTRWGGAAFKATPAPSPAALPKVPHFSSQMHNESAAIATYNWLIEEIEKNFLKGKKRPASKEDEERIAKLAKDDKGIKSLGKKLHEIEDMSDEREPHAGDKITVTLPAMASIICTVAHKISDDPELMKSMIEALAEIGHGKTLDIEDLQSVADHMNGEETQEVMNRDEGLPDHDGMDDEPHEQSAPADSWPGDGEKTSNGKTKVMDCDMRESGDYYGIEDIVAESWMSDEDEMRLIKRRAGLKFWG
jgi:hypothetical protein